jgi:hypothetical protein
MAIADTQSQPETKTPNFFGSLFASKPSGNTEIKTTGSKSAEKKSDSAIDKMARLVGLRGSEEKPAEPQKPKPAAQPASATSNGAIRPKPAEPAPVKTAEVPAPQPAAAQWPAPPAAPEPARAHANNSALSGAAPVVPAGSFDSRWPAFR